MIVSINKGHLVIPVTKDNYELVDTITIRIDKKDINRLYRMSRKFENLKDAVQNRIFIMWAISEFPELIYNKIEQNFPEVFKDDRMISGSLFRIDMIDFYNDEVEVHLDYLKRVQHISVKD